MIIVALGNLEYAFISFVYIIGSVLHDGRAGRAIDYGSQRVEDGW